ncbi:MAG: hypothetical protein JXN59_05705, partial [Anaerolineae bacterium]|nr:hypothetical protein [Anaerolineae bacterium]
MRMHISDGAMSQFDWYTNMPTEARGVMAQKGRQMLDTLQKFLVDAFDQSSAEHDIQHMGEDYARFLITQGLTGTQAMEAFLVFSDFLHEAALSIVEVINTRPTTEWLMLLREVRHFTNELVLGITTVYDPQGKGNA